MVNVILGKYAGFCPGVESAVRLAEQSAGSNVFCLGEISHNERVVERLAGLGIQTAVTVDEIPAKATAIIRSHGEGKAVFDILKQKGISIIDATCPFVKKIHNIVNKYHDLGYKIVIIGDAGHPEVEGIRGWCKDALVINHDFLECDKIKDGQGSDFDEALKDDKDKNHVSDCALSSLTSAKKVCVVSQTTYPKEKYSKIIEKISKLQLKTVEIFDTICYTTSARQKEAESIAKKCDLVLVVGSTKSSNARRLFEIAASFCRAYLVPDADALKNIMFMPGQAVGLLAGASTPKELVMEVIDYMNQNVGEVTVSEELKAGVEESLMSYREGKKVKGSVISADDKGVRVIIGGKYDGIIYAAETGIGQDYNPADYNAGDEIEAIIIGKKDSDTDCIPLSKRKLDLIKEGDKVIESIRGGETFELMASSVTKGGLLAKLGTYTVFIPSSQIKEKGFPKDLNAFVKKTLRLTVLDIDDNKHKIVASQKKVLETERIAREEVFWTHVKPNVIVNGTVKRITNFGAFVSVDGFDCLAHIVDLSWNHVKTVEEVLKKDESYDFIVLSADKEKGRVSLGYKQLQPHPYTVAFQKHPIGSICKGKIVSIVPFGAFVQIEPGIEGLVHVSEAAHSYVKNINEVVKVGDEVDVMILDADEASRRITLSIKACLPENPEETGAEEQKAGGKGGRKSPGKSDEKTSWNEDNSNNPFADLLKDVELEKGDKKDK